MIAADTAEASRLKDEAYKLALRLNGGCRGILAGEDAPGRMLGRGTAAANGAVPLWGKCGKFIINIDDMKVRIELDGMFGICARHTLWSGFSAHAVDWDRPFLSETGFRSFLGVQAEPLPGRLPDQFIRAAIASYVAQELKGRLVAIADEYSVRCRQQGI